MQFLAQYADWVSLVAAILFILALKGCPARSAPAWANRYGMIGMLPSVLITLPLHLTRISARSSAPSPPVRVIGWLPCQNRGNDGR